MAFTFEQLYKQVLTTDINTMTSSAYNLVVSNDINVIMNSRNSPSGKNLFVILESGRGTPFDYVGHNMFTQQVLISFYVPMNDTQALMQQLTAYVKTKNAVDSTNLYLDSNNVLYYAAGVGRTLTYSFNVSFNTPFVSPNLITVGQEFKYQEIIINGTLTYDNLMLDIDGQFTFEFQDIGPTFRTVGNINAMQLTSQLLGEKGVLGSSNITSLYSDGTDIGFAFTVLFNAQDYSHGLLRRYAFVPPVKKDIKITDNVAQYRYTAVAELRVNLIYTKGQQLTMSVTGSLDGPFTETYIGGGV